MTRHIALIGPMGSGKTTVGAALAAAIGRHCIDIDREVEARCGMAIAEFFDSKGEAAFRALECRMLHEALASRRLAVIATGGGVVLDAQNRSQLRAHASTVWLDVALGLRVERLRTECGLRPLLANAVDLEQRLRRLDEERRHLYRETADLQLEAGNATPAELGKHILKLMETMA